MDPRTDLDVPMIHAQSSNVIVDVWNDSEDCFVQSDSDERVTGHSVGQPPATDILSFTIVYI